jgi:hypothetical protein
MKGQKKILRMKDMPCFGCCDASMAEELLFSSRKLKMCKIRVFFFVLKGA